MPASEGCYSRPDRELVVKANFDRWNKRIRFGSARNCSYAVLKTKVEECFSLSQSSFNIAYKDDDGEITDITTDADLDEAIHYFQVGVDDLPVSSAHSILSGRSFGSRRITMRVTISVDFDGRLSDTSSMASMDEYQDRAESNYSLSFDSALDLEPEDDAVTISSRDTGQKASARNTKARFNIGKWQKKIPSAIPDVMSLSGIESEVEEEEQLNGDLEGGRQIIGRYPEDPSAVFERLKMSESSSLGTTTAEASERREQWLRDQRNGIVGDVAESAASESVSGAFSLSIDGEFERQSMIDASLDLQRDNTGKYYYTYKSNSSSASQADVPEAEVQMRFLASQQTLKGIAVTRADTYPSSDTYPSASTSSSHRLSSITSESLEEIHPDIPPEVLQFIDECPPPTECTHCSECDVPLDSFRYVCSTCGEKPPRLRQDRAASSQSDRSPFDDTTKGKGRDVSEFDPFAYPPHLHRSAASSSSGSSGSSWTFMGSDTKSSKDKPLPSRPLPTLPLGHATPPSSSPTVRLSPTLPRSASSLTAMPADGYELCFTCIQDKGVKHASDSANPDLANSEPSSPEELSRWTRSAPKEKGHFRHAFVEKIWGPGGWKDVEHEMPPECSTCSRALGVQRYKCSACENIVLCLSCYSQVHEIHPSHSFLQVIHHPAQPEQPPEVPDIEIAQLPTDDGLGEQSMVHPDVKCAHCLRDIYGALFHCAACEADGRSVDICSNCEAAGLPGNLDAPDGGHSSSHIMIKIPVPMGPNEVKAAGRRALLLWCERDSVNVTRTNGVGSRRNSLLSVDGMTVIGPRASRTSLADAVDHRMSCKGCAKNIVGVRYQCATCPSTHNTQYNLCQECEERSYALHDPMHVFLKIRRPVDMPIELPTQILPVMYKEPVGPHLQHQHDTDPKSYLQDVIHGATICDVCNTYPLIGEWYRCAYCPKDLCHMCEKIDEHDKSHIFFLFKAPVDMRTFRVVADLDNNPNAPILKHAVYRS